MDAKLGRILSIVGNSLPVRIACLFRTGAARHAAEDVPAGKDEILEDIKSAYEEWQDAIMGFEHAVNWEIIDYYIYRLKAAEIRYNYFIRIAKERGLRLALHENEIKKPPGGGFSAG